MGQRDPARRPADAQVGAWLWTIAAFVFAMIVVGGLTRLTDSGLSITEWRPVTGALPPLSAEAWSAEFELYRASSEYQLQNAGMTLAEFQAIYWWEWGHRFLGRAVGAVFLLPLIYFWLRGALRPWLAPRLVVLFILGGLQGAVGWWMVASGLVDRVDVSQYRLAAHLGLAFALLGAVVWSAADAWSGERRPLRAGPLVWAASGFAALVFIQVILGAFVAGLDAGRVYVDWPLMDGRVVPEGYGDLTPFWRDAFENRASVQFHHRLGGYLVVVAGLGLAALAWRAPMAGMRRLGAAVGALALAQAGLGVATLMHASPIGLSAAHQALAAVVFAAACLFTRRAALGAPAPADAARPEAAPARPG